MLFVLILGPTIFILEGVVENTESKMHKVKGKVKESGGKAVGNKDLEAEGKGENAEGKVQEKAGDAKKVGGK